MAVPVFFFKIEHGLFRVIGLKLAGEPQGVFYLISFSLLPFIIPPYQRSKNSCRGCQTLSCLFWKWPCPEWLFIRAIFGHSLHFYGFDNFQYNYGLDWYSLKEHFSDEEISTIEMKKNCCFFYTTSKTSTNGPTMQS